MSAGDQIGHPKSFTPWVCLSSAVSAFRNLFVIKNSDQHEAFTP